jgi:glutathione S-transferase
MKLYFAPGACSMASHIVANELGVDLKLEKVNTRTKQTDSGTDFTQINPKGYVPALELDTGEVLTEGPVVMQYLADTHNNTSLAPAAGTMPRYRLQETLGFINSEIHKGYGPLFNPELPEERRKDAVATLQKRYATIEAALAGKPYLFGEHFTIADAYLFVVTNWAGMTKVDLTAFPQLQAFQARVAGRPAVQKTLKAEGLIK